EGHAPHHVAGRHGATVGRAVFGPPVDAPVGVLVEALEVQGPARARQVAGRPGLAVVLRNPCPKVPGVFFAQGAHGQLLRQLGQRPAVAGLLVQIGRVLLH
ncbi:hypothetical protein RZS08_65595, partial [Arthrospira platensis SPKY1]|nr:hypothetical protein [Arthrospira platensis SPKY1]